MQAGEEELGALAGLEAGTIHIGASTTPGVYLLPDTLGCFRRDHPHVDVEVEIASTDEMIERLLAGRVQLALVGETEVDDRIELTPFLSDEIVGIAKPGLLPIKGGRIKPAALADQTLLVREAGSSTRQTAERALGHADARPKRVWELDSSEAIKRAAREGLGVAFLSRYAVAEEIERGELASFRLSGQPRIERRLYVARLARRPLSPSERGFIATLKRCCAKERGVRRRLRCLAQACSPLSKPSSAPCPPAFSRSVVVKATSPAPLPNRATRWSPSIQTRRRASSSGPCHSRSSSTSDPFDAVVASRSLHHIHDLAGAVEKIGRLLRPGRSLHSRRARLRSVGRQDRSVVRRAAGRRSRRPELARRVPRAIGTQTITTCMGTRRCARS